MRIYVRERCTLRLTYTLHILFIGPTGFPPSFFAFSRQLKKKKTPISTLPFPDFPILFFFLPFFEGEKIWRFEKNLHTKILESVVPIVIGLTVDRLNGLLILVLKYITSLSRREVAELFPFFFARSLGFSSLHFLLLPEYIFEDKGERLKI